MKRASTALAVAVRALGIGVVAAAVLKEMRKPRADRHWHAQLAGFVPYDFRLPSLDRLRSALWNPDSSHVLMPPVFGVGWSVNFGALLRRDGTGGRSG